MICLVLYICSSILVRVLVEGRVNAALRTYLSFYLSLVIFIAASSMNSTFIWLSSVTRDWFLSVFPCIYSVDNSFFSLFWVLVDLQLSHSLKILDFVFAIRMIDRLDLICVWCLVEFMSWFSASTFS